MSRTADCDGLLLGFAGDLLVDRDEPTAPFQSVKDLLDAPDIVFGNLEGPYTDDPHPAPSLGVPVFPAKRNIEAFRTAGFNVLSVANNHIVDAGHAALLETLAALHEEGVATCGAGATLAEARTPAILRTGRSRVAYLAYASVFPMGYEARATVPGLAPLRAYNHFHEAYSNYHIPGTPGRVETIPDPTDHANLLADLATARESADVVIASFHWGDFLRPHHLTDHERRTARLCLDNGADLVVGHHHHMLRGMEWINGRPVMYGLGHFVFDLKLQLSTELAAQLAGSTDTYQLAPQPGWPLLPMHPDARLTMLAYAEVANHRVVGIGFVPCRLRPDGRVEAVHPDSSDGREVIAYVDAGQRTQRLNGRIVADGPSIGGCPSVRVVPLTESPTR